MGETMDYIISFIFAAVLAGAPLLFGTLGEILTEKSGNLNLGVEGLMYMGAVVGLMFGYYLDSAIMAVLGAFLAGALGSLLYCFLTVTLKANQNVTGLTLTIFGTAFGNLAGDALMRSAGGTAMVSDSVKAAFTRINIPGLSDIPIVGKLFFQYNSLVYLGIALAIIMAIVLRRTRVGLNLRAVGENPATADAAGINVAKYKYVTTCIGCMIAGLGGLYYVMDYACGVWSNDAFGDRGWLAIALVIFTIWRPNLSVLASFLFGGLYILYLYIPTGMDHMEYQELYKMIPYVVTLVVLVVTSIRSKRESQPPASLGLAYFREER